MTNGNLHKSGQAMHTAITVNNDSKFNSKINKLTLNKSQLIKKEQLASKL